MKCDSKVLNVRAYVLEVLFSEQRDIFSEFSVLDTWWSKQQALLQLNMFQYIKILLTVRPVSIQGQKSFTVFKLNSDIL